MIEVCHGDPPVNGRKGLVIPGFVNSHTHIGDTFAFPAPEMPLDRLVAHPDGYKHRILRSTSREVKTSGMLKSLDLMAACGVSIFSDFREEGIEGIRMLAELLRPYHPRAVLLGRPATAEASAGEVHALLDSSDGVGLSACSDLPFAFLKAVSELTKDQGKLFSIHLSEAVREDVDVALSLKPDFVIHATMATADDLTALAQSNTPVVVCPRSNEFFGLRVDIPRMLKAGLTVGLGTDNGMICAPDMFEEMKAAYRISGASGGMAPADVVRMATVHGRKVLKAEGNTTSGAKNQLDLTVVRVPGKDPLKELVTTTVSGNVLATVRGGKVRRSANWR